MYIHVLYLILFKHCVLQLNFLHLIFVGIFSLSWSFWDINIEYGKITETKKVLKETSLKRLQSVFHLKTCTYVFSNVRIESLKEHVVDIGSVADTSFDYLLLGQISASQDIVRLFYANTLTFSIFLFKYKNKLHFKTWFKMKAKI